MIIVLLHIHYSWIAVYKKGDAYQLVDIIYIHKYAIAFTKDWSPGIEIEWEGLS